MNMIDPFLMELAHELDVTRKVLERVPDEKWDYTPHEKSMNMGRLASHIAESLEWARVTLETTELDMDTMDYTPYTAGNAAEMLATYDKNRADAVEAMTGTSNEDLMVTWTMKMGGETAFSLPRMAVLKMFIMNHTIHHRAQLTVYLRLCDIPVPAVYGPSADEQA